MTPDVDDLPAVIVTDRRLPELTTEVLDLLVRQNDPPTLFVRLGQLVRVVQDERGRSRLDQVREAELRHRLVRSADFIKVFTHGKQEIVTTCFPPLALIQDILACGTWSFPPVEAITTVPVLRADGSVLVEPGYDPTTRLVYAPDPMLVMPAIPERPTAPQLREAANLVLDLLIDFPFVDEASKANMLALLLTPIVRPAIAGLVPLALLDKPQRGTGASLLGQLVTTLTCGSATDLTTAPTTDEEWRKKITAALLNGMTILFFDNVDDTLSSGQLAAALTSEVWNDRILGRSEMARDLPQRCTWLATGNNLKVGGDLGRRCYWIRIDANMARPWKRNDFRHKNLKRHVRIHRGQILGAMLTLVRGWFAAGCPASDSSPTVGGFEEWTQTLGGILDFLQIPGFLGNLGAFYDQVDEDDRAWEAFLTGWYEQFKSEPQTVATIAEVVRHEGDPLREALPPELLEALTGKGSFERKLGRALSKHVGAIFGKYRLDRAGEQQRAILWKVSLVSSVSFSAAERHSEERSSARDDRAKTNSPNSRNSPGRPQGGRYQAGINGGGDRGDADDADSATPTHGRPSVTTREPGEDDVEPEVPF
jgi:hypothetical protein